MEYKIRMTDLPKDQRPRERLIQLGAESLTDAELLAIILRTGDGKRSAPGLTPRSSGRASRAAHLHTLEGRDCGSMIAVLSCEA